MKVTALDIPDVLLIEPVVHRDARGSFAEVYSAERYARSGIPTDFVQDNVSVSVRGVLRGLHFQQPRLQAKLVTVLQGQVFDVAVDVRAGSPWFGRWVGVTLDAESRRQLFIPAGFAHGFLAMSDQAHFAYKCSDYYVPGAEWCLRWDDPDIGVQWPVTSPLLSERDAQGRLLRHIAVHELPQYEDLHPASA